MNSIKKLILRYFHFNYLVLIAFCVFLVSFQVKSPLSILFSNRSVVVSSVNPISKEGKTVQIGNSFESRIVKYVNDHFFIQNPDCDMECADNCIVQSSKKVKGKEFSKNYFEACLVEDCTCEVSGENKSSGLNLLLLVVSLVLTYLVILLSTNPPNKSMFLGYSKLFDGEIQLEESDDNQGLEYQLL